MSRRCAAPPTLRRHPHQDQEHQPGRVRVDLRKLFLQNLAYEQVLVELTSQRRTDSVTPQRAKQIEEKAKKYLRASVAALRLKDEAKITAQGFVDYAATLASKVFTVIRMRGRQ